MDRAFGSSPDAGDKFEVSEPSLVIAKLVFAQIREPVFFPKGRFVFAPVPVKHLCQKPARMLGVGPLGGVRWNILGQGNHQWPDLGKPFCDFFGRFGCSRLGSLNIISQGNQGVSLLFKPVAQI